MASVIQALIFKHRTRMEKLENWAGTSDEKRAEGVRLQKLAEGLMVLIVITIYSSDRIENISEQAVKRIANKLLEQESETRHMMVGLFKKILGQFVVDEFASHPALSGLKDEFELIYEEEDAEEPAEQADHTTVMEEDDEEELQNLLRNITISETASSRSRLEEESVHLRSLPPPPLVDNSFDTWGGDTHSIKVLAYLREISAPQTELTYLCQSMGWQLSFLDRAGGEGQFEVVAEVKFEFKRVRQVLQESFVARNKKQGRMFSSMKMLKKIYLSFPEIWDMYDQKRTKKSLAIAKSELDPRKFPAEVLNERIEPISSKSCEDELSQEKEGYLTEITSFKSEFNLLNQHNPGVFSLKVDKMSVDGAGSKWKVKGKVAVKYRGRAEEMEKVEQHLNSKVAEENVVKYLVTTVYQKYPEILQTMMLIKTKKGIRT